MDPFADASPPASPRSLVEYLEVPLRRPWLVTVPLALVVSAGVVASMVLPKKYLASTFILVESEKAPATVVPRATQTERSDRRMLTIPQQILTQTRLEQVIKDTNPYAAEGLSLTDQVDWLRSSTKVLMRGPDAFDVQYVHANPEKAAEVVNRLATLFIEETTRARAAQVEDAYSFLETEVGEARRGLEQKEEAVRRYKEAHMGSLPEQSMANLATLQRLQMQAQAVGQDLRAAVDRQAELERQIAELSGDGTVPELEGPRKEISQLRSQLANLRTRYTDEHPDVQAVMARLKQLESSVPSEPTTDGARTNPVRSTAEFRLEQARREVALLQDKRTDLEQRIAALQSRLDATPRVEQELTTITRDFGNLKENYLGLVNKKLDAQMAAKLEERWKGEQYRIVDPAHVPDRPFFPNQALFVTVGAVLGLLVGLGAAVLAEILDHSFKNLAEVEAALPFPVLAAVPHMKPPRRSRSPRPQRPQRERSILRL